MRILTVDDSATMRRIIRNALKAIGYEDVLEAENGQAGLNSIQRNGVEFVITDWSMPVMTGLELVRAIRAQPALQHLPILMITAVGQKDDIVQAVAAGVDGYIVKPFDPETLHQKIRLILAKQRP
jgi:two-component system chemotaxis response regulator CheY